VNGPAYNAPPSDHKPGPLPRFVVTMTRERDGRTETVTSAPLLSTDIYRHVGHQHMAFGWQWVSTEPAP
jgi:hypothetical protein